jgi:hypothetical protein
MAFSRLRSWYHEWKLQRDPHYRAQKARGEAARREARQHEEEERRAKEEFFNRTVSEIVPLDVDTYLKEVSAERRAFADGIKKEKGDIHARADVYELFAFGDVPAKYLATASLKAVLDKHLDGLSKMKRVPLREVRDALKRYEKELPAMDGIYYPAYALRENAIGLELCKRAGSGLRWQGVYTQVGLVPLAEVKFAGEQAQPL